MDHPGLTGPNRLPRTAEESIELSKGYSTNYAGIVDAACRLYYHNCRAKVVWTDEKDVYIVSAESADRLNEVLLGCK
jgi:hypothetical protein